MEENIIEINKYMYFDKNLGKFYLTSEAEEIIYKKTRMHTNVFENHMRQKESCLKKIL